MKKASVLIGATMFSVLLMSFSGKSECEELKAECDTRMAITELQKPFAENIFSSLNIEPLNINEIAYAEFEESLDLGFDTAAYLPVGFNAYEGMVFDLDAITYMEVEEEVDLGFDPAIYLPKGFNAFDGMEKVVNSELSK